MTIIPRGRALGLTQQLPLEDKYTYSKEYIEAELAVMMGGRLAEEVCLGRITTGASNDFEKATDDGPADGLRVGDERDRADGVRPRRRERSSSAATSPASPTTPRTRRGRSTPR